MRMHELIADIIALLDRTAEPEQSAELIIMAPPEEVGQDSPLTHAGDDINRFRQIVDLADKPTDCQPYANSPNEKTAGIEAVTTHAGGGVNGPKHPHDLRVKDPSMYPNQQEV
jgi:hypothetical protein